MSKRIDEYEFAAIKRQHIVHRDELKVARIAKRSVKTVLQVINSKTFEDYQKQNKAQHPPVQFSLRDNVLELHRIVFYHDKYVKPSSAAQAIIELIEQAK